MVRKVRSVEEPHGVSAEGEIEGGRETPVPRTDDSDVHVDTVSSAIAGYGGLG
jgi:hypothetical protein